MEQLRFDWRLTVLRLSFMVGVLGIGTAMVRNGTSILHDLAYGVAPSAPERATK